MERYSAVEFQDLIAYWESTHRFPVSSVLIRSDPYLALFVVERKNRRSHAGARWKQILQLFLIAMREGWCSLDLLLDPYFLHFPKRTDEVAWPSLSVTLQIRGVPTTDCIMRAIPLDGSRVSPVNFSTWQL
ncbi:hypothetical protein PHMEG_00016350 [Phytophthora megakarya]|uniref:Uncharacterized protein n=1 Tax=Phytophthora megakarya TaxID=4795 RepID=A0A225W060_9STRA|nr:hypothetical protein PHMEG_00016350 [Phytophthora megakarya]